MNEYVHATIARRICNDYNLSNDDDEEETESAHVRNGARQHQLNDLEFKGMTSCRPNPRNIYNLTEDGY